MFRPLCVFLLSLIVVTACRHDTEQPVPEGIPDLTLEARPGYVSGTQIISKNTVFPLSVIAEASEDSKSPLVRLTIERNTDDTNISVADTSFSASSFRYLFSFRSLAVADTEQWKITIYDQSGKTSRVTFNLVTQSYPPNLTIVYPNLPLGCSQPFEIAINGSSNSQTNYSLKRFSMFRSTGSATVPFFDSTLSGKNLVMFRQLTTHNASVTETFTVKLEDTNGEIKTVSFKIYVANYMLDEHEGILYNSLGSGNYGWDLLLNIARSSSDSENETDMFNFTDTGEFGAPYYFNNGWMAGNATRFKRANWYEYENATNETAVDAFTGGTISDFPSNQATSVSAGDVYIANIRNQNQYCVIRILEVNQTTGDDMDFIRFVYKK